MRPSTAGRVPSGRTVLALMPARLSCRPSRSSSPAVGIGGGVSVDRSAVAPEPKAAAVSVAPSPPAAKLAPRPSAGAARSPPETAVAATTSAIAATIVIVFLVEPPPPPPPP